MEYMNARSSQRFLTYIIDFFLIQIVVSFIVSFIPAYVDGMEYILEFYRSILQGELTENIEILTRVMKKAIKLLGIILSVQFPVYILYLVVLPHFWKNQTLGRMATHVRVISKDGKKAKVPQLMLRELVGGLLLLNLCSGFFIIPLLYWYFSSTTGRSLADMIGGTRLIDTQSKLSVEKQEENTREYVDAYFKEVSTENPESAIEEETEYKVI